ncbi:LysR family transcriptional regulator [Oscillibacter sp. MSJ-2]|uniref:LysR family transcriptional regulator n=1 Tax=Dysosmobacter acutus TaxID=2841504 RepID=A0ABS6FCT0_9FIRM|nr:LysR family transcriptional regulator [Dysosmobacter acutus]MBU5627382.1 LysR family transcriptional regulator [Dysosmobacter acutus]
MKQNLTVKLTVRLFAEEKCFGPGVAQLLALVDEVHSLRAAAMRMDMAYSKAWKIIRAAEAGFGCKLLFSTTGGRGGGGAVLTEEARQILTSYRRYCTQIESYGEQLFREVFPFCAKDQSSK